MRSPSARSKPTAITASVFTAAASGTVISTGCACRASMVTLMSASTRNFGCISTAWVADE